MRIRRGDQLASGRLERAGNSIYAVGWILTDQAFASGNTD